jgi:hypothetical protein
LIATLTDKQKTVCLVAARALEKIGDPRAAKPLRDYAQRVEAERLSEGGATRRALGASLGTEADAYVTELVALHHAEGFMYKDSSGQ